MSAFDGEDRPAPALAWVLAATPVVWVGIAALGWIVTR